MVILPPLVFPGQGQGNSTDKPPDQKVNKTKELT